MGACPTFSNYPNDSKKSRIKAEIICSEWCSPWCWLNQARLSLYEKFAGKYNGQGGGCYYKTSPNLRISAGLCCRRAC